MKDKTVRLGLIGKDVSKSSSAKIHTFILQTMGYKCEYEKHSVSPSELDGVVRHFLGDLDGFNVTIPYKRDVFEYIDEIVGDAFACGAVNTVVCKTKTGYNTDGMGFLLMLERAGVDVKNKTVLILGAGGSGRSSALALKNAGANVYMYRRSQMQLKETCDQLGVLPIDNPETGNFEVIVNCTGVGMHDTVGKSPVTAKAFENAKWAVDLIYEPTKSEFLRLAEQSGAQILNGESMLFYQAYYADCLFIERQPNAQEAENLYQQYRKQ